MNFALIMVTDTIDFKSISSDEFTMVQRIRYNAVVSTVVSVYAVLQICTSLILYHYLERWFPMISYDYWYCKTTPERIASPARHQEVRGRGRGRTARYFSPTLSERWFSLLSHIVQTFVFSPLFLLKQPILFERLFSLSLSLFSSSLSRSHPFSLFFWSPFSSSPLSSQSRSLFSNSLSCTLSLLSLLSLDFEWPKLFERLFSLHSSLLLFFSLFFSSLSQSHILSP